MNDTIKIVHKCESTLKQCKNLISRIEIETRDMQQDDRSEVRKILKERASKLKELARDCKWTKKSDDNLDEEQREEKYAYLDEMNEDEIIGYAQNIQMEDINILDRCIQDVDQTNIVAENAAAKLYDQTEQIGRVGRRLDDIDDEAERAKRVLKIMIRRVMTDKVIWCVAGLIVIAVIIIIIQQTDVFSR